MLGYRAQCQYRQEGEPTYQQHCDNQQGNEQRAADREVTLTRLLARAS